MSPTRTTRSTAHAHTSGRLAGCGGRGNCCGHAGTQFDIASVDALVAALAVFSTDIPGTRPTGELLGREVRLSARAALLAGLLVLSGLPEAAAQQATPSRSPSIPAPRSTTPSTPTAPAQPASSSTRSCRCGTRPRIRGHRPAVPPAVGFDRRMEQAGVGGGAAIRAPWPGRAARGRRAHSVAESGWPTSRCARISTRRSRSPRRSSRRCRRSSGREGRART